MKRVFIIFSIFLGLFYFKYASASVFQQLNDSNTHCQWLAGQYLGTGLSGIAQSVMVKVKINAGNVNWSNPPYNSHAIILDCGLDSTMLTHSGNCQYGVASSTPLWAGTDFAYGQPFEHTYNLYSNGNVYNFEIDKYYRFYVGSDATQCGGFTNEIYMYGDSIDQNLGEGSAFTFQSWPTDKTMIPIPTMPDLYYMLNGVYRDIDEILFSSPLNYLGQSPQTPYFNSAYSISSSTSWNAIRIKLNQWLYATSSEPLATNYVDTYLDYGNYQTATSSNITSVIGELTNGYYNYYAEFLSKNHSSGEVLSEGGYTMPHWFWIGLSEGNPYAYPLASSTASTTPLELCAGIDNSNLVGAFQWGLCNIAQWLFVPNNVSVQNFQNLSPIFQQKTPFAYFYSIQTAFNNLSATSTKAFELSTSTGALNTSIFQPIKTGLTWILWLMFGIFVIKRIAKFDF